MNARFSTLAITPILWSVLTASPVARASVSLAEALFHQGIELMESGRYDEACPKLEQSLAGERRSVTILALADCNTKRGRLTAAIKGYEEYLHEYEKFSSEKQKAHEGYAKEARVQRDVLLLDVAAIVLVAPPGNSTNFEATVDGVKIGNNSLGLPFVVDPGDHTVILRAPGVAAKEIHLHLKKGQSERISVALLNSAASASTRIVPEKQYYWDPPPTLPPNHGLRTGGFLALGVGTSGLVVGTVALVLAVSAKNESNQYCRNAPTGIMTYCQTQTAVDTGNHARASANAATFGFGVAIAGAVVGGSLLIINKYGKQQKPDPLNVLTARIRGSADGIGISVEGAW
ncbi:MAG: tetratricopeptide repeat protein [Polyangiaceae bacterium]|nr:tetratricopeptide repeat protein [Polyangiaceae bacterium]